MWFGKSAPIGLGIVPVASKGAGTTEVSVLEQATVDRLRQLDGQGYPILSVYIGLEPGPETLRAIPTRIKDVLSPIKDAAAALPRDQRMSVREDIESLSTAKSSFIAELGRGIGIFKAAGAGIDEHVVLPGPVRDRAVLDTVPYLRPLEAMLDHYRRFCVAVVDGRFASIFRFRMDELETWEEMASGAIGEEDFRKPNYGGFSGYDERRVRAHADELLARHYRAIAARLDALLAEPPGYDLLIVGGPEVHAAGVVDALGPELARRLAGTFVIDPHTKTPATVLEHTKRVAAAFEAEEQERLVDRLMEAAASSRDAVLGVDETAEAANRRAVDTLVIQAERTAPGWVCRSCGWLALQPRSQCVACGGPVERVPDIVDALGDSVRSSGGRVQHVVVDTRLADAEVGAFLRYQQAQSA
jgi:peptide chain release factor subunit 1